MSVSTLNKVNRVPIGLKNTGNNCFINALFQVIANDPVYSFLFVSYLPDELSAWKTLIEKYKSQQEGHAKVFSENTQVLRSCFGNIEQTNQNDCHEAMMKLFGCLPDGNPTVCSDHRRENMVAIAAQQERKGMCNHNNNGKCKNGATWGYPVDVWISGRVLRFLEAGNVIPIPKNTTLNQLTAVEYENGNSPYIVSNNKYSQILLPIPQEDFKVQDGIRESLQFEDLLDNYAYVRHKEAEQYTLNALDCKKNLRQYRVAAEKWEFSVDNITGELPLVLPIVIQRFTSEYNSETGRFRAHKITRPVVVPFNVNFAYLFNRRSPNMQRFVFTDYAYELYAFMQHLSSNSVDSGHYVTYLCTSAPGTPLQQQEWYLCNDSQIARITDLDQIEEAAKHSYVYFFRKRIMPDKQLSILSTARATNTTATTTPTTISNVVRYNNNNEDKNISLPTVMRPVGAYDYGRAYQAGDVAICKEKFYCSVMDNNLKFPLDKTGWYPITETVLRQYSSSKPYSLYGTTGMIWNGYQL